MTLRWSFIAGTSMPSSSRVCSRPDEANLDRIDAIRIGNDRVVERVDDPVVKAPVHCLRLVEQAATGPVAVPGENVLVVAAQAPQLFVGDRCGEECYRLPLQEQPELERVAHQREVDVRDLHPPLRHRTDEPLRLEPGDQLADGAEREAGQGDELALRDELPRLELAARAAAR